MLTSGIHQYYEDYVNSYFYDKLTNLINELIEKIIKKMKIIINILFQGWILIR